MTPQPPMTITFLELADPLVQGSQGTLDLDSFFGVISGAPLALLQSVHPRQHLPLQVIDLALQQILEAVGLAGGIEPAVLLRGCKGGRGGKPYRYAWSRGRAGRPVARSPQGDCGGSLAGSSGEWPSAGPRTLGEGPARHRHPAEAGVGDVGPGREWRWGRAEGRASQRGNSGARGPRGSPGGF